MDKRDCCLQVEGEESQVDAEVGDCRDKDAEGVGEGLAEGGLELREMARRVTRDEVHEGMHFNGGSPLAVDGGGGAVVEGQGSGRCRLPGRGGQKPMTAEEEVLVENNNRAQMSCASGRESAGAINAI